MLKKDHFETIAEDIGVSPSAVSKAVRHCPGLRTELRECILERAHDKGILQPTVSQTDVYVIMPETPAYFWMEYLESLSKALVGSSLRRKINVYSHMGDRATVERYLDEAEALHAKVIVISAEYEGLAERLSRMALSCAVFTVIKAVEAPNVFFFGSDQEADGRLLARKLMDRHPQTGKALLIGADGLYCRGATEVLAKGGVATVRIEPQESPSGFAQQLDRVRRTFPFEAVLCLDGITAKLCVALKKCGITVPCYGLEDQLIEPRYLIPIGIVCQDLLSTAKAVVAAAEDYVFDRMFPQRKYSYISAEYREKGF